MKDPITVLELEAPQAKMNIDDQIWPSFSSRSSHITWLVKGTHREAEEDLLHFTK